MVWHVIDRYQFLALSGDDAGHVFLNLIVMLSLDQALPSLHSENNLNVDLGVRIRHFYAAPTELGIFLVAVCYKDVAPTELHRYLDAYGYKYAAPTELAVFLVAVCYKDVAPNGAAPVFGCV